MSFPRYAKYKDSGVVWLGEIPENWAIERIAGTTYLKGRVGWKGLTSDEYLESGYALLVTGTEFKHKFIDWTECNWVDQFRYEDDPYIQLREGDLLITKDGTIGKLALVAGLEHPACLNSGIFLIRPLSSYLTSFMYWVLGSNSFRTFCDLVSVGSTIQHLYQNVFERFSFPSPPLPEQRAIAEFLDSETTKIDALIEEQRKLIALMKEKRQAIISHAVTKGLNATVAMKNSGIDWVGLVPKSWTITRLSNYAKVENGSTPSRERAEFWSEEGIPWLSSGEVNQEVITFAKEFITAEALAASSLRVLPLGTVVVGLVGQGKTRGMAAILQIEATVNQNLAAICPRSTLRSEYLCHLFRAAYESLREAGRGGQQAALNCEILSAMRIPVPPENEQDGIIDFIRAQTERYSALQQAAEATVLLLQERRDALVSAAITGKIDVRQRAKKPVVSVRPYNSGFAHQVLAATILERCNDKHMGRVKLQKLIHVTEHHAQIEDLKGEYTRQMAGPLDMKAMAGLERGLEKQHWYRTVREGQRYRYQPLEKKDQHQKYLEQWADKQERIEEVLTLMGGMNMRQCEIVSTLYAAWNDLLIDGLPATDDAILDQAATAGGWHESKERTPRDKWVSALQWMRQHALIPTGFGSHTRKASPESIHEPA